MKKRLIIHKNDTDYITVLLMILCSGTVFFNIKYNSIIIPLFCIYSTVCSMGRGRWKKNKFWIIELVVIMFLNGIFHIFDEVAWNGVIQNVLYIIGTGMACASMSFERYKNVYIKIVSVLTVIAICVFMGVSTGVLEHIKTNVNGSFYQMALLHVVGWGDTVFNTRMCGLFHEPGMFQIILNIAVLYITDNILELGIKRRSTVQLILFIFAILLTRSTSGYIVLCITLSILYVRGKKYAKKWITKVIYYLAIPIVIIIGYNILSSEVVIGKFTTTNISYNIRLNDIYAGMSMLFQKPILGYGYNSMSYTSIANSYGMDGMSNGVIGLLLMFGIPLATILIVVMLRNTKKLKWNVNRKIVIMVLFLEELTESMFFFPVSLAFLFPYYQNKRGEKNG